MDGVKKILVVDDEADICNILKFNLDKAGMFFSAPEDKLILKIPLP